MDIKANMQAVKENIAQAAKVAGKKAEDIQLIAVSKTVDEERIKAVAETGHLSFGENYVQEFIEKYANLPEFEWHFIGQLQTNKVKYIVKKASLIHTLDRPSLAKELDKRYRALNLQVRTLIQVNIGQEAQKGGIAPDAVESFIDQCKSYSGIAICGLMCIPPYQVNPEDGRVYFERMRNLYDRLNAKGYQLTKLSMGMSADYALAIEEGANIVRVGSAIFGAR